MTITKATLIVNGMQFGPLDFAPVEIDNQYCAMTGEPISNGYSIKSITTIATNEFMDTFPGGVAGYVSETVGRAFRNDQNMGTRLFFEDGTMFYPFIARESAEKDGNRPCWSDLVRSIWPDREGQSLLCLLTTDSKKRIWPRARPGVLGLATSIYLHDNKTSFSANIVVNWPLLIQTLDAIEEIYALGFTKFDIKESLYGNFKLVHSLGYAQTTAFEQRCSAMRPTPEFTVAILIAQKPKGETP